MEKMVSKKHPIWWITQFLDRNSIENIRKQIDINLVTTEARRNYLVSETNCHTSKKCSEQLLAIEMKKIWMLINKTVCLGLSVLEIKKKLMHEF